VGTAGFLTPRSSGPAPRDGRDRALDALEPAAIAAARAAALACRPLVGRGDPKAADAAATDAMRASLAGAPGRGTVVIGEGEKDDAPMLYNGEQVGTGSGPEFDVAVDPLECTDLCASGLAGALATIAFAPSGALWSPGPAHYMDKLVAADPARDAIDLRDAPEDNLARVAQSLGKPVEDMRVFILNKPRHRDLIARMRAAGARVLTPPAGDVAGAVLAALPGSDVDLLMGVGGTPEGVLAACAVQALGGGMQGRLAPQGLAESQRIDQAGIEPDRLLTLEDLVAAPDSVFVAAGVSGGPLLRAPWERDGLFFTQSLVVRPGSVRWLVEATPIQEG
jgi:fructose-1,6-bisphosphatase II